ncbi:MAG TPA: pantetheine-phosphate adenylyltransferase [Acidimicrobiales bacterium]|nr:pantetheine-phosphate adenylyltransferase [Acidimicrobiales bacterium]
MRTVLFPGSFDPFHNGHLEIVEAASRLFQRVVITPVRNPQKAPAMFSLEERRSMIAASVTHLANVEVSSYEAPMLVVDVARAVGAEVIVKGLRVSSDAEAELQQAQMNKAVSGMETVLVPCSSVYSFIASRWLRDFMTYGGADRVGAMVPAPVFAAIKEKFAL